MVIESVESVNINFHEKVAERMRRAGGEAHVLMERFDIIFIRQINSQSLKDAYTWLTFVAGEKIISGHVFLAFLGHLIF